MRQFLCFSENGANWREMIKVFISYSSQQEDCVEVLVKTMEGVEKDGDDEENKIIWDEANNKYLQGKKYKILFHERDFIAGREIIYNIQNCVEECDKMFILLTPDFLKSEWCRLEVSTAQSQDKAVFVRLNLNKEQENELTELLGIPKNRPIKQNLETRTYLKWSGNIDDRRFWTQVVYLLDGGYSGYSSFSQGFRDTAKRLLQNSIEIIKHNRCNRKNRDIEMGSLDERTQEQKLLLTEQKIPLQRDTSHEEQEWYHPGFEKVQQAIQAMKNMANLDGTYLVTNVPNTETEAYIIVRRGEKCSDIGYCIVEFIHQNVNNSGFRISGTEIAFPSLFQVIEHSKMNPIPIIPVEQNESPPTLDKTLTDPLPLCRRCRRCSSREDRNTDNLTMPV